MTSLNAQWLRKEAKQMRHDGKAHWAVHTMASQMEQAADEIEELRRDRDRLIAELREARG